MSATVKVHLTPRDDVREKPWDLTIHSDLSGLYVVKMGRKSTPNKLNPGKSVRDQFKEINRACGRWDLFELARIEEDKQGASQYSKTTNRVAWERCLQIIQEYPVAVLAIWELSRATRRLKVFGEMMELLEKRGTLLLVGDRLYNPASSDDKQALGINAVIDEGMVARGRDNTLRGLRHAAEDGKPHGPSPYGYIRKYHPRSGALLGIELEPQESEVLREMARRVLNNESAHKITKDFTERKIIRSYYGGIERTTWYPGDVRDLMTNPVYKGVRTHQLHNSDQPARVFTGIWPALFAEEEWDRIQVALDGRSKHPSNHNENRRAKYLLTGIVKCGKCNDGRMHGNRQGGVRKGKVRAEMPMVYHCPSCRSSRQMRYVDQVVRDTVTNWLSQPKFIRELASAEKQENPHLLANKTRLEELEQELEEAYQLSDAGKLSARGLSSYETRLLPEIERLKKVVLQTEQAALLPNAWKDLAVGKVAATIPDEVDDARAFLERLIRVRILPAGRGVRFHDDQVQVLPLTKVEQE